MNHSFCFGFPPSGGGMGGSRRCGGPKGFPLRGSCHAKRDFSRRRKVDEVFLGSPGSAGEFRRLRAARRRRPTPFLLFPFEREETGGTVAPTASCFPLVATSGALPRLLPRFIRHRRRFGAIHASKEEKGACWKCLPQYSQTELSAQCAASGGARSLELADACHEHFSNERPAGLDRIAASCVFSHNVRGRHFSIRKCRAAGQAAHCTVSTAEEKSVPKEDRRLWLS